MKDQKLSKVRDVENQYFMKFEKYHRQERFVQKVRFKARVKRMRLNRIWVNDSSVDEKVLQRVIGMSYHTRAACSCAMCGNSRKHFKERTVQELSFIQLNKNLKYIK